MKTFGIIAAMQVEQELIKSKLSGVSERQISGFTYYLGTYKNNNVVLATCSIGKVNAALCTQIMIDNFKVECMINTGIAGSFSHLVKHLDIVISKDVTYYDVRSTQMSGWFPFAETFKADDELVALACEACGTENVHIGRVLTGDDFVDSKEKKDKIALTHNGLCVEMEGAAIAHACTIATVPFVIVRCISDMADGAADDDYKQFERIAAEKAASIVLSIIG